MKIFPFSSSTPSTWSVENICSRESNCVTLYGHECVIASLIIPSNLGSIGKSWSWKLRKQWTIYLSHCKKLFRHAVGMRLWKNKIFSNEINQYSLTVRLSDTERQFYTHADTGNLLREWLISTKMILHSCALWLLVPLHTLQAEMNFLWWNHQYKGHCIMPENEWPFHMHVKRAENKLVCRLLILNCVAYFIFMFLLFIRIMMHKLNTLYF